jgi:hypothetical protein
MESRPPLDRGRATPPRRRPVVSGWYDPDSAGFSSGADAHPMNRPPEGSTPRDGATTREREESLVAVRTR